MGEKIRKKAYCNQINQKEKDFGSMKLNRYTTSRTKQ